MLDHRRLALLLCLSLALFAMACGDDDDDAPDEPAQAGDDPAETVAGMEGGPEPALDGPASQFTLSLEDMAAGYVRNPSRTFVLDAASYGGSSAFTEDQDGEEMLDGWGYLDGYETEFQPEGRETDVLQGKNYVFVESHLFDETDGAHGFYEHLTELLEQGHAEQVRTVGLANESSAWRIERGVVPESDVPAGYSWFVFRRGNLVSAVKVYGAADFVKSDSARDLAVLVDERALGERPALEPAPAATAVP